MFFSIIVPVYNVENYIEECVSSILEQTFKDYEIILVDDGSTDCSSKKCDELQKKYPSIIEVIHKVNEGQFSARRTGISVAKGEYIIPLDADDKFQIDALSEIYSLIKKTDADMVFFDGSRREDFSQPFYNFNFMDGQSFVGDEKREIYFRLLKDNTMNSFCMKAYKKVLFDTALWDAEVIKSIRNGEDMMQLLPIITAASKIVYLKKLLYYYRPNPTSVTRKYNSRFYESRKVIYDELTKYIIIWKISEDQGRRMLSTKTLSNIYCVIRDLKYADSRTIKQELVKISYDPWFAEIYNCGDKQKLVLRERMVLGMIKRHFCWGLGLVLRIM